MQSHPKFPSFLSTRLSIAITILFVVLLLCFVRCVLGKRKAHTEGNVRQWIVRMKPELIHTDDDRSRLAMQLGQDYNLHGEPVSHGISLLCALCLIDR